MAAPRTTQEVIKDIFERYGITSRESLDRWCGSTGRKKLYGLVETLASQHYATYQSAKSAEAAIRSYYEQKLPGYKRYKGHD